MLELHQFHPTPMPIGDLALELFASQLDVHSGRCAYVSWRRFARAFLDSEWMVEDELREAARRQPWQIAVISQAPEGEAPIALETVPAENCRLGHGPSHRFHWIAHQFADMPKLLYHHTTLR